MSAISLNHREKGQGLVEYALILVLVSITVIAILSFLGDTVGGVFQTVDAALNRQEISDTGTSYVIGGFSASSTGSGMSCTITIPSVSVTRYDDGEAAGAGQNVSISVNAGAGNAGGSGTTDANGVAVIGPISLSGACSPGTATITAGSNTRSSGY